MNDFYYKILKVRPNRPTFTNNYYIEEYDNVYDNFSRYNCVDIIITRDQKMIDRLNRLYPIIENNEIMHNIEYEINDDTIDDFELNKNNLTILKNKKNDLNESISTINNNDMLKYDQIKYEHIITFNPQINKNIISEELTNESVSLEKKQNTIKEDSINDEMTTSYLLSLLNM